MADPLQRILSNCDLVVNLARPGQRSGIEVTRWISMIGECDAIGDIYDTLKEIRDMSTTQKPSLRLELTQDGAELMTIDEFQSMCAERNENGIFAACTQHWVISDYSNAIAGEAGELCNLVKKLRRGDFKTEEQLREAENKMAKECADIITYTMVFLSKQARSAAVELLAKFHEVSERRAG